jgi:hypothetical protein
MAREEVVMRMDEYRPPDQLPDLKEFLLTAPNLAALEIDRSREPAGVVELATEVDDTP